MNTRRRKIQILLRSCIIIIVMSAMILYVLNKKDGKIDIKNSNTASSTKADITEANSEAEYKYTVCIDAGHGGTDVGTTGIDGSYEKDDNLELALLVADELTEKGINVVLTRTDDSHVELSERSSIANQADADLFVSLHRNYIENHSEINGVEIWIHSSNPTNARNASEIIMDKLVSAGISENLGVKTGTQGDPNDNYKVLRETKMPGMIIEMGYMSSEKDLSDFKSNKSKYAAAIADGIAKYLEDSSSTIH